MFLLFLKVLFTVYLFIVGVMAPYCGREISVSIRESEPEDEYWRSAAAITSLVSCLISMGSGALLVVAWTR